MNQGLLYSEKEGRDPLFEKCVERQGVNSPQRDLKVVMVDHAPSIIALRVWISNKKERYNGRP